MVRNEADLYPFGVTDLSQENALVIAPHPDDESLGCGGSIIRHIKAGSRVKVLFLTDGDRGDFEGRFGQDYVKIRRACAVKTMEILGVEDYEFWSYGDRDLGSRKGEAAARLLRTLEAFNPSLVYVPSPFEAHPDHRAAFEILWEVRERAGFTVALYEILMALYPNALVDITEVMPKKREAISSYFTEVYYNDYVTKVEGLNRFRTATLPKTVMYAEAFALVERGALQEGSLSLRLMAAVRD